MVSSVKSLLAYTKAKSGTVRDMNTSKTGAITITVFQANGELQDAYKKYYANRKLQLRSLSTVKVYSVDPVFQVKQRVSLVFFSIHPALNPNAVLSA